MVARPAIGGRVNQADWSSTLLGADEVARRLKATRPMRGPMREKIRFWRTSCVCDLPPGDSLVDVGSISYQTSGKRWRP